jgi:hypothetical protein
MLLLRRAHSIVQRYEVPGREQVARLGPPAQSVELRIAHHLPVVRVAANASKAGLTLEDERRSRVGEGDLAYAPDAAILVRDRSPWPGRTIDDTSIGSAKRVDSAHERGSAMRSSSGGSMSFEGISAPGLEARCHDRERLTIALSRALISRRDKAQSNSLAAAVSALSSLPWWARADRSPAPPRYPLRLRSRRSDRSGSPFRP